MTILAVAAIVVFAAGCSKEGAGTRSNEANAIDFRAVVDKGTRASTIENTAQLTSFFVQASAGATATALDFMSAAVYRDGANWTYAPQKYYPSNGDAVNFYAYVPIKDVNMTTDMALASGNVTFGYTVPADQTVVNTSTDLLVSSVLNQTSGTVAFTFDHALSAATFSAKNLNATTSELTYVISKIEITELDNVGTFQYPFSATSWTNAGAANITYKAGLPAAGVALVAGGASAISVNLLSANDVMIVLPQEPVALGTFTVGVADDNGTYVEVTYSLKDGSGAYIYENEVRKLALPTGFEFVPGTRYNFEFEFAAAELIVLTVTAVNSWTDQDETLLP